MTGSYLLDTNIAIAMINSESSIMTRMAMAPEVAISSITVGELCYGALKSRRSVDNLARLDEFFSEIAIIGCDATTGKRYAEIKDRLRRKGRPVPEGDLWIASIALQYGLILVTRDSDFNAIDDLILEVW